MGAVGPFDRKDTTPRDAERECPLWAKSRHARCNSQSWPFYWDSLRVSLHDSLVVPAMPTPTLAAFCTGWARHVEISEPRLNCCYEFAFGDHVGRIARHVRRDRQVISRCPLNPQKRTCAVQRRMSAKGQ